MKLALRIINKSPLMAKRKSFVTDELKSLTNSLSTKTVNQKFAFK
jgi:hypothetical protein